MPPIEVGFIGLSSHGNVKWGATAHLPYFSSARGRERFHIIAIQNSSRESALQAIRDFDLPSSTRVYGSPEDMAADPDVQLVVDVTGVMNHYETILPSLKAGKDAFVEWPLTSSTQLSRQLTAVATENNLQTGVGFSGRFASALLKVKEVLESGKYGKVLSSEVKSAFPHNSRDTLPYGRDIFAAKKYGVNTYTIGFGHLIDALQYIFGEIPNPQIHFQVQRPELKRMNAETNEVVGLINADVPDLIILTASLAESANICAAATLLVRFRKGASFKGEPAFSWTINCEKGELRVISPNGPALQLNVYSKPVTIEVHDFIADEVVPIEWSWHDYQLELPADARATAAWYEAYAEGHKNEGATFQDALRRQKQLETWLELFTTEKM